VIGRIEPTDEVGFVFDNKVVGGTIPSEYIGPARRRSGLPGEGAYIGHPVQGMKVILEDGDSHAVDSSDMAFMPPAASRSARATTAASRSPSSR